MTVGLKCFMCCLRLNTIIFALCNLSVLFYSVEYEICVYLWFIIRSYLVNSLAESDETLGMSTEMLQRLVLLEQLSLIRIQKQRLESLNNSMCTPIFWLPIDNAVAVEELLNPAIDVRFGKPTSEDSQNLKSTERTNQMKATSTTPAIPSD